MSNLANWYEDQKNLQHLRSKYNKQPVDNGYTEGQEPLIETS